MRDLYQIQVDVQIPKQWSMRVALRIYSQIKSSSSGK